MLYPPCQKKADAPTKLSTAHGRSSSTTAHIQRQPTGGACFMTARYPYLLLMWMR
jgi:hypothetical protein